MDSILTGPFYPVPEGAFETLEATGWYPKPIRRDARIVISADWFTGPNERFSGYALIKTIILKRHDLIYKQSLVLHELCHIWQWQHRKWDMIRCYALPRWLGGYDYETNPYEVQAREAGKFAPSTPNR